MSRRRWVTAAAVVLAAGGAIVAVTAADAARGATETVYSRTVYGPDFRGLDHRVTAQFIHNTGGGIYGSTSGPLPPQPWEFEAPVDLPVGANVTSVSFFYADCGFTPGDSIGTYYFGSYKPSAGQFTYLLPKAVGGFGICPMRYTFTQTDATIATVQADRRYVLGAHVNHLGRDDDPSPVWILYGARVRYTCPTTCK